MPSNDSSKQNSTTTTHQDFRWISASGQSNPLADFVELTRDIVTGIHSCLQIFYASELQRTENLDSDLDQQSVTAVGTFDADNLLRLSIASSALLKNEAMRRVNLLNMKRI